ncbi:DUF1642 domain-containing protein [Streptococcus salivarius]
MDRKEAIQTLSKVGKISVSYAEDLYDSFFPKPVVSQVVADWYEENKDNFEVNLFQAVYEASDGYTVDSTNKFWHWLMSEDIDALTILVNMHQFGYEVEKEPRYMVRIKGVSEINRYLNKEDGKEFLFSDSGEMEDYQTKFTRKELEEDGFGWVFDCEGVEVKEVDDGND